MYSKGSFVVLSCLVAGFITAPANVPPEKLQPTVIPIVSQSEEIQANGSYKFSYETGNGIIREESAYDKLLPKGRDLSSEGGESNESEEIHVQRGSYSYTAPDGTIISVRYIADENGFQPIYETIPPGKAKSADKSGRALKLDTSESSVGLAPRIGSSQTVKVNSDEKAQTELAPEASSESAIVPEVASVAIPEEVSAVIPEVALASVPEGSSVVDPQPSAVSEAETALVSESTPSGNPESVPAAIPESAPAVVSDSISPAEASTIANEALTGLIENSQSTAESGAAESNLSTLPNIDVSTEVASTVVSDQPSTEPEQDTTASSELSSSAASDQPSSSEVVESSSSTSAPEQSSTVEAVGQQAVEESVASSPAEKVGKPAANASESVTPEESSSTTISA